MGRDEHKKMIDAAIDNYGAIALELAQIHQKLQSARRVTLVAIGPEGGPEEALVVREKADLLASDEHSPTRSIIADIALAVAGLMDLQQRI